MAEQLFLPVTRYKARASADVPLRAEVVQYLTGLVPWAAQSNLLVETGMLYVQAFAWRRSDRPDAMLLVSPLQPGGRRATTRNPEGQLVLIHSWVPAPSEPPHGLQTYAERIPLHGSIPGLRDVTTFRSDAPAGQRMPWEVPAAGSPSSNGAG